MKIGLSLSGGAAKGLMHLGVIKQLELGGIRIDMISGCSIGALIGAMYALNPDADNISGRITKFLENTGEPIIPINYVINEEQEERRSVFNKIADSVKMSIYYGISLAKLSYLTSEGLRDSISQLVPDVDFSECKIPFSCAATDITDYTEYYFTEGSILDAVVASCSLPGLYPPFEYKGKALVDGGWAAPNHIDQLREMGAGFVIASNIQQEYNQGEVTNGLDVVLRSNTSSRKALSDLQLKYADILIQPDTCNIHWWDFGAATDCMDLGEKQTAALIPEIRKKIRRARIKIFFSGSF